MKLFELHLLYAQLLLSSFIWCIIKRKLPGENVGTVKVLVGDRGLDILRWQYVIFRSSIPTMLPLTDVSNIYSQPIRGDLHVYVTFSTFHPA